MQVNCSFCFLPPGDAVSMAFLSSFIEVAERLAGKQAVFFGGGGAMFPLFILADVKTEICILTEECLDGSTTSVMTPIIVL